MAHPEHPEVSAAFFIPESQTSTSDGVVTSGRAIGTDPQALDVLREAITASGIEVSERQPGGEEPPQRRTGSSSTSIGFAGTPWRAKWTPAADVRRMEQAAQRTPRSKGNPKNN